MKYLLSLMLLVALSVTAYSQTAMEIIEKAENQIKGDKSTGTFTMNIVRPEYERTLKMKSWWSGNEKALIEITYPPKEAGNKTLKIGNEIWNYLKNTETTMKIPPSMMLASWNGSDLTNDDLVRESDLVEDYDIKLLHEEKIAGEDSWKLELKPKPDAPVVWDRMYYWVRKGDYLPALIQYYDEKGELVRTMKFSDYKEMDGRKIPAKWKIIDNQEDKQYTEFIYDKVDFDAKIPDRIFSLRELER